MLLSFTHLRRPFPPPLPPLRISHVVETGDNSVNRMSDNVDPVGPSSAVPLVVDVVKVSVETAADVRGDKVLLLTYVEGLPGRGEL